jgi:hypothetical protein
MLKFEPNKKYTGRFICDSECIFEFEVISRSDKRIEILDSCSGKPKKIGVTLDHEGNEMAYPFGKYSMAPCIRASRYIEKGVHHG